MSKQNELSMTRRQWLIGAAATAGALLVRGVHGATSPASTSASSVSRYRISAADWMLLKRQKPGALKLAHECNLDGIEVDMGPLGKRPDFENNLLKEDFRSAYLAEAQQYGLAISSLAMSAFYGQPFADHPKAAHFLQEWIDVMPAMGAKYGFLPIRSKSDLASDDAARSKFASLFKAAAPRAEKAGVIMGINTPLDAESNVKLLEKIASPAVRIAYNCGEAVDAHRDVYQELRTLGGDRLAEIVPTLSDGKWLEKDNRIDVPKLKRTLDEIGWSGWLVLQRSRRKDIAHKTQLNFSANAKYLKSIFQT
jgi:alpha-L-rhamnosidase